MSTATPQEDAVLTARLRSPQTVRAAFNDVVKLYSEPLYWLIRKMVNSHMEADDVLQNTFLKAWNNIENFRGEAKLSTWLYKIAVNESLSHIEREKKHQGSVSLEDASAQSHAASDNIMDGDELTQKLMQAIATLPEKQRLVFNMKYFDDMKYEEMSEILGTSVGALKASYHLASKKIEQFFTGEN